MNMATQSFGYGLAALLFCVAILGVCHNIKKAARKVLKSQQTHKGDLPNVISTRGGKQLFPQFNRHRFLQPNGWYILF